MRAEEFLAGSQLALAVHQRVVAILDQLGPFESRVSKSQIAFRRKRGFAFIWRPDQYLSGKSAEVVVSIALGRHDQSPRFKEVTHPTGQHWIHHLEISDSADVDETVSAWLAEAYERAG